MRDSRLPSETRRPRPRSGRRQTDARSATIREVARAAGVSVATVSRVLNGKGPVRDGHDAHACGRRPIACATSLTAAPGASSRGGRTRSAFSFPISSASSSPRRSAASTARRAPAGYQLLVSGSHGDRAQAEAALRAMRGRVDGLVVMSPNVDGPTLSANLPGGWPVMLLNCAVDGAAFDSINIDNEGGAAAMVMHLAALGHRRIAHVTGPADNWDARERLRGYRRAVRARGVEDTRELEVAGRLHRGVRLPGGPLRARDEAPRPRRSSRRTIPWRSAS